jgi:hypothetical protein
MDSLPAMSRIQILADMGVPLMPTVPPTERELIGQSVPFCKGQVFAVSSHLVAIHVEHILKVFLCAGRHRLL